MSNSRQRWIDVTSWIALASHHEQKWIQEIESGRAFAGPLPAGVTGLNLQDASQNYQLKLARLAYVQHFVHVSVILLARLTRDGSWTVGAVENSDASVNNGNSLKADDLSLQNLEIGFTCPLDDSANMDVTEILVNNGECTLNGVMLDTNQRQAVFDSVNSVEFAGPLKNVPLVKGQFMQSRHQILRQVGVMFRLFFARGKGLESSNPRVSSSNVNRTDNGSKTDEDDQTDNASKLLKRMDVNDLDRELLYAGVPASICRVVTDLIHSDSGQDNEGTAFQSLVDVLFELKEIISDRPKDLFYTEDDTNGGSFGNERRIDFGNIVYGRRDETHQLLQMAARPNELLRNRLVLIGGKAGEGKSFMVEGVTNLLVTQTGWVHCRIKFDRLMQNSPLAAIAQGFESFFTSVLSINGLEQYIASIALSMQTFLSPPMIALLCDLIPSLRRLFPALMQRVISDDDLPSLVEQGEEVLDSSDEILSDPESSRNRLYYSMRRLVHAIATQRALVLVLDDLHWASRASLDLLTSLMIEFDPLILQGDAPNPNILFVGLYRSEEVGTEHILSEKYFPLFDAVATLDVLSIQLQPFTKEDCNSMVSSGLRLPLRLTRPLANAVHAKTLGNVFHVKMFIESLVANNTLYYSLAEGRWMWDMNTLAATRVTDSAAQLLMRAIDTLPDSTRQALRLLSCLGSKAEESTLLMLEDAFAAANGGVGLIDALAAAISRNVVEKDGNGFRFAHDIIEQNVYDAMTQSDASDYHMLIGEALVSKDNTHIRANFRPISFVAIDQINTAMWTRSWDCYSFKFAGLNLKAAESSMELSDFDSAFAYVEHGLFCLWNHHWEEATYKLNLGLEEIGSRACFAISDYEKMQDWIDDIIKHTADCLEDRHPTELLLIEFLGASGKFTEAIESCWALLEELGETLPDDISPSLIQEKILSTKNAFSTIRDMDIRNIPRLKDWNIRARMKALSSLIFIYFSDAKYHLIPVAACRMVNLSIEHGFSGDGVSGLVVFANCLRAIDMNEAYECGKLSLSIYESFDTQEKLPRLKLQLVLLKLFFEPLQACADLWRNNHQDALRCGDALYSCLSITVYTRFITMCGNNLCSLEEECKVFATQFKQPALLLHYLGHCSVILSLSGSESLSSLVEDLNVNNREDLLEQLSVTGSPFDVQEWQYNALVIDFWFMKYEEAAEWAKKYHDLQGSGEICLRLSDVYTSLYEGLTAFQLARKFPDESSWIEIGQRSLEFFGDLVKHSVWNWENKQLLLQAELYFLQGNKDGAIESYEASIKSASEHRFLHEEGLAFELLSSLYTHYEDVDKAKVKMVSARNCYDKWGAKGIIDLRAPAQE